MPSAIRNLVFFVVALTLMIPAAALAESKISGSYQGKAKSLDGSKTFGTAKFVQTASSAEKYTLNREGSAKFTLKKK